MERASCRTESPNGRWDVHSSGALQRIQEVTGFRSKDRVMELSGREVTALVSKFTPKLPKSQ